jgi:hypothetical protein
MAGKIGAPSRQVICDDKMRHRAAGELSAKPTEGAFRRR